MSLLDRLRISENEDDTDQDVFEIESSVSKYDLLWLTCFLDFTRKNLESIHNKIANFETKQKYIYIWFEEEKQNDN